MMRDEINDRLRAAVHHFKTGDGAPTVSGLGGDWATTDISVSYDDGYMVLHLKPLFPVTDLTADKPAGGAPLELEGLKFTTVASGVTWQHKDPVYLLTWAPARRLSDWLCVEVDKHRAPVGSTLQYTGVTPKEQARQIGLKNRRDDLSPEALTAAVWSGEGLPPVGCVCEFVSAMSDGEYWHPELKSGVRVEIVAHFNTGHGSGDVAAFVFDHRSGRQVEQAIAKCFRPLRTAEQLAAEAREAALKQIVELIESADSKDKTIAEALYDAGLRFPDAGYRKEDA